MNYASLDNLCCLCGGSRGTLNDEGAHNLCAARAAHGQPTPSLGEMCPTCEGRGRLVKSNCPGPCFTISGPGAMTDGQISRSINALYPKCPDCDGKGHVPGSAPGVNLRGRHD